MVAAKPKQIFFVLGMHRSGTSCLTGTLQQHGLFLGKHHTWNPHNQRGNRENQDVVDLHDEVLASNDAAWDHPPKQRVEWQEQHRAKARAILEEYSDRPLWGFKDPRALLVLDGWKQLVPQYRAVGIIRHPISVVRSLQRRGGMPYEQALHLWYVYNSILYRELKRASFPLLSFDDPAGVFESKASRVALALGLEPLPEGEAPFFSQELRHYDVEDTGGALPWRVRWLYARLRKRAL